MYKIVSVTDKHGNPKNDFMNNLKAAHPSLEGEVLNEDLLQNNIFLGNLRFKWNDDSGKMLATSYVTDCRRTKDKLVISTINSIYTLKLVKDEEPAEELWSWKETCTDTWSSGLFSSRTEAIENAYKTKQAFNISDDQMSIIDVAKCEYAALPTYVSTDTILDELNEKYLCETGDDRYLYDGVLDNDLEWLEDKLSGLINEFHKRIDLKPYYFFINEQEQVDLTEYGKQKHRVESDDVLTSISMI